MSFCTMSSFKHPPLLCTRQFARLLIDSGNVPTRLSNSVLSPQSPYPPHSPVHSTAKIWKERPKTRAATATPHRTIHKQPTKQQVQ